jgi:ERCC4-type nuclease
MSDDDVADLVENSEDEAESKLDLRVIDDDGSRDKPSLVLPPEVISALAPHHQPERALYARLIMEVTERIHKLKTRNGVHLLVDSCEQYIRPFFDKQPWVSVRRLPCCDFLFVLSSGVPLCGFERKAQPDLASSVVGTKDDHKDMRFAIQKEKMKCLEADRIAIILEGSDLRNRYFELNCECNTLILDRMQWTQTRCLLDTVLFLYRYALGMFEAGDAFGTVRRLAPYETFQSINKSVTPEILMVHMLSCVPSFSSAKAKAVADKYQSMGALISKFDVKTVANLFYLPKGSDKKRKVGPASAAKVYTALFNQPPPSQAKKKQKR